MIYLLAVVAAAAAFFLTRKSNATEENSGVLLDPEMVTAFSELPDVPPELQKGVWTRDYDQAFLDAKNRFGVPFALLKAHAIRESRINPDAKTDEGKGRYSYGLMQVMWWKGSNRLNFAGYPDDYLGDGSILFDPQVNAFIGSQFILQNWTRFKNVRDMINAYNTGVAERTRVAPNNYVNDVLNNYRTLIGLGAPAIS